MSFFPCTCWPLGYPFLKLLLKFSLIFLPGCLPFFVDFWALCPLLKAQALTFTCAFLLKAEELGWFGKPGSGWLIAYSLFSLIIDLWDLVCCLASVHA